MKTPSDDLIHKTAWLYYGQGMRQEAIAAELGISRGSVVNYLKRGRDIGAVRINLPTGLFRNNVLARKLEDALGVDMLFIIPDKSDASTLEFSIAAGQVVLDEIKPNNKIGLAWGETLYYIVENLPMTDVEGISVLQMCGNLEPFGNYRPDQCTVELAIRFRATAENIYAPLVLQNKEIANKLKSEPVIAKQLERLKMCDVALFSAGSVTPDSHVVDCGAMTPENLAAHVELGAVAMIAGRMIAADGEPLDCEYNRNVIAMDHDVLKAIPNRICFADRADKADAFTAACRGGFVKKGAIASSVAKALSAKLL